MSAAARTTGIDANTSQTEIWNRMSDAGKTALRIAGIVSGIAFLALGTLIAAANCSNPIILFGGCAFIVVGFFTGIASHACSPNSISRIFLEIISNTLLNCVSGPFLLGLCLLHTCGWVSENAFIFPENGLFLNFTNFVVD